MIPWMRDRVRILVLTFFLAAGSTMLCFALIFEEAECYVKCSPVIEVTNYSYFQQLLGIFVKNYLVSRFKTHLAEKFDLEYMTGSLMNMMNSNLTRVTDFSSVADSIMNEGLTSELNFVRSRMNVENFTDRLNSTVLAVLGQDLRKLKIDERDIKAFCMDYENRFLNSRGVIDVYAGQVADFQSMAADFMPVTSRLTSRMSSLSGKMDIADSLKGMKGSNDNTRTMLAECTDHTRDGLKTIAFLTHATLAESVNETFCTANSEYLVTRLKRIGSGKDRTGLSDRDIARIVSRVNNAAVQIVPDFIAQSTASLADIGIAANAALERKMKDTVQSALSAIGKASSIEKETERSIDRTYRAIENDIRALAGDARRFGSIARDKHQPVILDETSMKKIMVLITGRTSSAVFKKLAIKHYIAARTSQETALTIKTRLAKFDPAAIDSAYEDMAWKDLARFNYYLLLLENQKMKLLAIRAMIESIDTDDPDLLGQVEKAGLPPEF